jgi:hypothetical protein
MAMSVFAVPACEVDSSSPRPMRPDVVQRATPPAAAPVG